MVEFQISVNGELRRTVAVKNGTLRASAIWQSLEMLREHATVPASGGACFMMLGGMESDNQKWEERPQIALSIGDRIEIRIANSSGDESAKTIESN